LQELGYDAESTRQRSELDEMLAQSDVVVTSYSHAFEKMERRERLIRWMESGGHLVLETKTYRLAEDSAAQTPLLNQFGINPVSKNPLFDEYATTETQVQIYRQGTQFNAAFVPRYTLELEGDNFSIVVSDDNGVHLAEVPVGAGTLTVLSDMDIWRNEKIGDLDHAALLAEVLGKSPGRITILHYLAMPSLAELIWRHAKTAVVPLIALLLMFLWFLNDRFGPPVQRERRQRRSLIEHIEAAGQFDWRFNRGANVLKNVRHELQQYIESRHPTWRKKSEDEKVKWVSEKTKLAEPQIRQALFGDCANHGAFLSAVSALQTIRKQV
jgi:hypothetical protein